MAISITIRPGKRFARNEKPTTAKLNQLGSPTATVSGIIGNSDLAATAVKANVTVPDAYFYSAGVYVAGVYALTVHSGYVAYVAGSQFYMKADTTNPGAVDININGLGAKNLFKNLTQELEQGDLRLGQLAHIEYDGTSFQLLSVVTAGNRYATSTGTANAIVLTTPTGLPAVLALSLLNGRLLQFKANLQNTGPATLAIDGLTAKAIVKFDNRALVGGEINLNSIVQVTYDSVFDAFVLGSPVVFSSYSSDTGSATAYVLNDTGLQLPPALFEGYTLTFRAGNTNAGAATVAVGALAAQSIRKSGNIELDPGDIAANDFVTMVWNSNWTAFEITSRLPLKRKWVKFDGVPTSKTITNTVDQGLDQLTVTGHGLTQPVLAKDVQRVSVRNSGGALPSASPALAANTVYYARVVDANTLTLHTTAAGAIANTNRVDLTGNGTGTNTLDYITVNARYGVDAVTYANATGEYFVWWAVAFSSADYLVVATCKTDLALHVATAGVSVSDTGLATSKRVHTMYENATAVNASEIFVMGESL